MSSISILQLNNVNFQIKQFVIYQKFLANLECNYEINWNNLYENEVYYTKIFENKATLFFIGQIKTKKNSGRSMLNPPK